MELKEFISKTLQSIANGIIDAQSKMPQGTTINPSDTRQVHGKPHGLNENTIQNVEFDVALTVIEGTETKGGIGVLGGALNLGMGGKSETANTLYNRIRFSVPMVFSQQNERRS